MVVQTEVPERSGVKWAQWACECEVTIGQRAAKPECAIDDFALADVSLADSRCVEQVYGRFGFAQKYPIR